MLMSRVRTQVSASRPMGRPTAAYTSVNTVPSMPSCASVSPNSLRIGSPSTPGNWRSKKLSRLTAKSSSRALFAFVIFMSLHHFEQPRRPHAATHTHRHHHVTRAEPFAGQQRMTREPLPAHAERMADGDRAAVDIEPRVGNAEPVTAVEYLHRERLVELPETDVLHREPGAFQ